MNIYVSNLSFNTRDQELNELFSAYGTVTSAKVIMDRETGRPRGFGFVEMSSEQEGHAAINGLNNKDIEGRYLSANVAKDKPKRNRNNFDRFAGSPNSYGSKRW